MSVPAEDLGTSCRSGRYSAIPAQSSPLSAVGQALAALPLSSVEELVRDRRRREPLVRRVASARLPTRHGELTGVVFESLVDRTEHIALVQGDVAGHADAVVHIHHECPAGDTFGSLLCSCRHRLHAALTEIAQAPAGVLVYLRQPDATRARFPRCSDNGHDVAPDHWLAPETAATALASQILTDLGILTTDPVNPR
jgi:3,4-dihydroxy 2-butanone 4-phosphate synthase / GTP cyclohydrolase II